MTLISLQSGNTFPLFTENRLLCGGIHRESPWIDPFHFGNPIAKEKVRIELAAGNPTENMAQEIQAPAIDEKRRTLQSVHFAWGSALICVLVAAVYYRVLAKLVIDWWQLPDFSHGFLVPIFAAYMVWAKRKTLLETRIAPTWSGIVFVVLGLVVLVLGVYGAELFLSRVSLVILLAGLVLCFGGWELLKELRYVLLVLLLAIPIPSILFNEITLPLQFLASKLASVLLSLFGVPVLREGNVIELPAMKLEVVEACSGIRSLMSLFTLSVFYGYFLEKSIVRKTAPRCSSPGHMCSAKAITAYRSNRSARLC